MKRSNFKDEECPSNDFSKGKPNGKCWSDGHFMCQECEHYREDFKRLGQDYIDFAHTYHNGITMDFVNLKK